MYYSTPYKRYRSTTVVHNTVYLARFICDILWPPRTIILLTSFYTRGAYRQYVRVGLRACVRTYARTCVRTHARTHTYRPLASPPPAHIHSHFPSVEILIIIIHVAIGVTAVRPTSVRIGAARLQWLKPDR